MCYVALNGWLGWLHFLAKFFLKKQYVLCRFQWLTWLTSLLEKIWSIKNCICVSPSVVDLVDFTFWPKNWENLEHKKSYMCVAFSGWLGWLYFLGKKWRKKTYVFCSFQWLTWLTSLFEKIWSIKNFICVSPSVVDLVDFTFWPKNWENP